MPKLHGRDKSQLPRGIKSTRAEYGVCGTFLGVPKKMWIADVEHQVFVLPGEEKSHIIIVPKWCRDEVFRMLGATYSFSKHAAEKVLFDACTGGPKITIWHHGILNLKTAAGKSIGIFEDHAERLEKLPTLVPTTAPTPAVVIPKADGKTIRL